MNQADYIRQLENDNRRLSQKQTEKYKYSLFVFWFDFVGIDGAFRKMLCAGQIEKSDGPIHTIRRVFPQPKATVEVNCKKVMTIQDVSEWSDIIESMGPDIRSASTIIGKLNSLMSEAMARSKQII